MKITRLLIILLMFVLIVCMVYPNVQALSRYGSNGEEVRKIQTKLKEWGYYNGSVDGIFEDSVKTYLSGDSHSLCGRIG